jgi:hypothetical protein
MSYEETFVAECPLCWVLIETWEAVGHHNCLPTLYNCDRGKIYPIFTDKGPLPVS